MTDIIVPSGQWKDTDVAVVGSWLYADGETVSAGTVIVELMVEKTSFELVAPASGSLSIGVEEEVEVHPGQVIGSIG